MASPIERDPSHTEASNAIAPSNAPNAAPKRAPPSMVPVATIEAWVKSFLRAKQTNGGWPTIYCKNRRASNLELARSPARTADFLCSNL